VRAGLLTALVDGLFSSVLNVVAYRSTVSRLFQGVASVLVGREAFNGGAATVVIGVLMHVGVAFGWSAVFLFLVLRSRRVRALLASPYGVIKVAALYGPFVWMVMSLAVIPILVHRPPTIGARWWIQLVGHIPFVGLPIVASSRMLPPRSRSRLEVPSPILPARELQQQYGLYAENRPAIRLDPERVPAPLRDLIPLAETWGIGDDIIRFDFEQKAPEAAKRELVESLDGRTNEVDEWLHSRPPGAELSEEAAAFMYLLIAWDEVRPR